MILIAKDAKYLKENQLYTAAKTFVSRMNESEMFSSYRNMPLEATYLVYAAIFPSVAYGMFYTDISYFLTAIQGISYEIMGLVITSMGVSTFVASIFLGIAADVYGRKKMLVAGNVLSSIILPVFALTTNSALLVVAGILEGISEAAVLASSSALLADKTGTEKRNSVFSMYSFVTSVAFGLGSIAIPGIVIFELIGFTNKESHILLYILLAIFSLASTLLILRVSEPKRSEKRHLSIKTLFQMKSKGVLGKYVLTGAIIAFGAGMVVPLMTTWFGLHYGVSDIVSGPILGVSSILIGAATLAAPPLAKKFGLIKAIASTQTASMIFMFATPCAPTFASASIVYILRALLMNMASPLQQSMIMGLVPADERGAASGLSGALWRLPNALSTFIGAWMMGLGMLAEPFFVGGVFYLISIMLFWLYFRRVKMPEEQVIETQVQGC